MQTSEQQFSGLLKQLRKHSQYTVQDITQHTKVARSRWYRWESGEEIPLKIDILQLIFNVFSLQRGSQKWFDLMTYSCLSHRMIPHYINKSDDQLLYIIFKHIYYTKPTAQEFTHAIDNIIKQRKL